MDYSKERFVRIYTRTTPKGQLLGFWGRAVFDALLKVVDDVGIVEVPEELAKDRAAAIASLIQCDDVDYVAKHMTRLVDLGQIEFRRSKGTDFLVIPNFCLAQYTSTVDRATTQAQYRARQTAIQRATEHKLLKKNEIEPALARRRAHAPKEESDGAGE